MESATRFDLKLDRDEKDLFAEAAALMGTTMAGFVRTAAKEKARALIEQERRINLSNRDFAAVTAAVERAFEPNEALRGAIESARNDSLRKFASQHRRRGVSQTYVLVVDAKAATAVDFYRRYGFTACRDAPRTLYLAL
jgi:uncharacterized protein (DUF1778 family)